jgi:hypothetical protein
VQVAAVEVHIQVQLVLLVEQAAVVLEVVAETLILI